MVKIWIVSANPGLDARHRGHVCPCLSIRPPRFLARAENVWKCTLKSNYTVYKVFSRRSKRKYFSYKMPKTQFYVVLQFQCRLFHAIMNLAFKHNGSEWLLKVVMSKSGLIMSFQKFNYHYSWLFFCYGAVKQAKPLTSRGIFSEWPLNIICSL